MNQQIKLSNGYLLDCIGIHGRPIEYQGVKRDSLTFLFAENQSIDFLNDIFSPENCTKITIISESGEEDIHTNYTIRIGLGRGYKNLAIASNYAIGSNQEELEKVCWVQMAQTSLAERQLQSQSEVLDMLLLNELEK